MFWVPAPEPIMQGKRCPEVPHLAPREKAYWSNKEADHTHDGVLPFDCYASLLDDPTKERPGDAATYGACQTVRAMSGRADLTCPRHESGHTVQRTEVENE